MCENRIIKSPVHLINLKHRTDRKMQSQKMLQNYNFEINVFDAISDKQGWIGCAKSHICLIKHAKANNMDYIIVVEDDIDLLIPSKTVDDIIVFLSKNSFEIFNGSPTLWDVRNNLPSVIAKSIDNSPKLGIMNWGQTATFMIYNKSVYDFIIDNYNFDEAFDQFISRTINQTIYIGDTPFCKQRESYSDIQGKNSMYGTLFHDDHAKILNLLDNNIPKISIGVYGIFIGTYKCLYKGWIDNISRMFFPDTEKKFYIVTDDPKLPVYNDNTFIFVTESIGWPYETLYRFKYFLNFRACDVFASDIIYFVNANGRFKILVSNDVMPTDTNYVFTKHHGYLNKSYANMSFEKNPISTAYVVPHANLVYYGGGFYGATTINFMQMCRILDLRITEDEKNGYIAVWHDESHLNWYANTLLKNTGRALSINYHVPEEHKDKYYDRVLVYLDKNSTKMNEIRKEQYKRPRANGAIIKNKYNAHLYQNCIEVNVK
jgi:hypothetical protein